MDAQAIELLEFLKDHQGSSSEELAHHFAVSERTVRTYVRRANDSLGGVAQIERRRGEGYRLVVEDQAALDAIVRRAQEHAAKNLPSTHEERVRHLLNDLLNRTSWITLEDLAGMLYISPRTLSSDLRDIQQELSRFDLSIERRPRYGIRVAGSEINKRLCLTNLVVKNLVQSGAEGGDDAVAASLKMIARCVDDAVAEEHFAINPVMHQNLVVHIVVAIERIRAKCYVPLDPEHLQVLVDSPEYAVAERIARCINCKCGVDLPREEVAYIAIHLSGKQVLTSPGGDADGGNLVISDEVWDVVSQMLEKVWQQYRFDFRHDLELRMNLARHIVPLSVRLQYHMHLENPILSDFKHRYPFAYAIAADASTVVAQHYGAELSADEVGYIALSFALAMERQKAEAPKKNILVVCASGVGSAKLLEYRYRRDFGAYVDNIVSCDVRHVADIDFSNIDYVFTTVPITEKLPVPVRQVTFFLEGEDVDSIREMLRDSSEHSESIIARFSSEAFLTHLDLSSREEVLDVLVACARRIDSSLPDAFAESVREREALGPTSFGNKVAMPHPMMPMSSKTFVVTALLDSPVVWNDHPVQAVFLLVIAPEDESGLKEFYEAFTRFLWSPDAVGELLYDQRFQTLERLIRTFASLPPGEPMGDVAQKEPHVSG